MSKDYKSSKRPAASSGKRGGGGGGGTMAGLFIGLCLGLAIAVGAALYLNKTPNLFAKQAPLPPAAKPAPSVPEILAPTGAGNGKAPNSAVPPAPGAQGKDGERFDFYTMLPELGGDQQAAAPAKPAEATPPATVQPPRGSYLQVGAFQNETDADNLKAKLALLGMEAGIQTTEVAGKGVLHRVRVGPLAMAEDVDRIRAQLRVNGMDATLVKQ